MRVKKNNTKSVFICFYIDYVVSTNFNFLDPIKNLKSKLDKKQID